MMVIDSCAVELTIWSQGPLVALTGTLDVTLYLYVVPPIITWISSPALSLCRSHSTAWQGGCTVPFLHGSRPESTCPAYTELPPLPGAPPLPGQAEKL